MAILLLELNKNECPAISHSDFPPESATDKLSYIIDQSTIALPLPKYVTYKWTPVRLYCAR